MAAFSLMTAGKVCRLIIPSCKQTVKKAKAKNA